MTVVRLADGRLQVPRRAVADSSEDTIGDGVEVIGPEHPDYEGWLAWEQRLAEAEAAATTVASRRTPIQTGRMR
jgi:hypothetical protein